MHNIYGCTLTIALVHIPCARGIRRMWWVNCVGLLFSNSIGSLYLLVILFNNIRHVLCDARAHLHLYRFSVCALGLDLYSQCARN